MSFISVFDVMGPNMIGPSSSHTATSSCTALLQKLTMVTVLTELCWVVLWDSLLMICASEILLILLMKKV